MTSLAAVTFRWDLVWESRNALIRALGVTLNLWFITFSLSVVPALAIAVVRTWAPRSVRAPFVIFVYLIRAVPALLTLFMIFYALPFIGPTWSAFTSVVIALMLVQVVYFSEVFRAALQSVGRGQYDAGHSLGLRPRQVLQSIVLPQSAAVAAPSFASACVQLMHNTTIAGGVVVYDLLGRANVIATNRLDASPIFTVGVVYVLMLFPMVRVVRRLERRLGAVPA